MGVVYRDGDRLIKKLDDWIAKGYQSEPCQGRRS
jgi:hypothetical protein